MPRGSRPGERRGGRKPGTPNKKTLLKNAVFMAAATDPNRSPLDFMLAVMRDPQVPLKDRIDMAEAAAPFIHLRPDPVRKEAPDPLAQGDPAEPEKLQFASLDAKPNGHDAGGVSPLDFLLGAMTEPTASPRERLKAARIAARYKHAHGERAEAPSLIVEEDKFGFKVDPELARAERDDRLRERRLRGFKERSAEGIAAKPELERIAKRREERVAAVKFTDGYTYLDRRRDEHRLGELHGKRLSRKKLTGEEEAEEAHLAVRALNPTGFEQEVRIVDWRQLNNNAEALARKLTRMATLLGRRRSGGTLTAAEEEELQGYECEYPNCSAKLGPDGKGYLVTRVRMP